MLDSQTDFLNSAKNATQVGNIQPSLPFAFCQVMTTPLTGVRENICDLNSGDGSLILAAANSSTNGFLGLDIERIPTVRNNGGVRVRRITGDLTKVYTVLREANWVCDLFVLYPPSGLHWYRNRLEELSESSLVTVKSAFRQIDPGLGPECIDSAVATWLISLDRMSMRGEGMIIMNAADYNRLVASPSAPYRPILIHVWAMINITLGGEDLAVLYYSREHSAGPGALIYRANVANLAAVVNDICKHRVRSKKGAEINSPIHTNKMTANVWEAVKTEWKVRLGVLKPEYNVWLEDGNIKTHLTPFDQISRRVTGEEAQRLFQLNGKSLLQLVMQSHDRTELRRVMQLGIWRIHPNLQAQVENANREYQSIRAPLRHLSDTQRLGYLDEEHWIVCKEDLFSGGMVFRSGERYAIRTQTHPIQRRTFKPSLTFEDHEYLFSGRELAVYITDATGKERCVMDKRVKAQDTELPKSVTVDLVSEDLVKHFEVPEVPTVADLYPEKYANNQSVLDDIEARLKGFKYKSFQREDYAAFGLIDGGILAHDTGLGKSIAGITIPLIWLGLDSERRSGLYPQGRVLIVAPEGLHAQMQKEWREKFGFEATAIESQDKYLRLTGNGLKPLRNGWYITSFNQLAANKVLQFPDAHSIDPANGRGIAEMMHSFHVTIDMAQKAGVEYGTDLFSKALNLCKERYDEWAEGLGEERKGIRCVYSPSFADLAKDAFDCVVVDEATRMKGAETIIGSGIRLMRSHYRLLLTGTPIKNRLPDIFYLALWSAKAMSGANARWPYGPNDQSIFAETFLVSERNLSEERAKNNGNEKKGRGGKPPKGKLTAAVCNSHRLWKLLSPVVLRRRKSEIGGDIVKKIKHLVQVPMGREQAEVYYYHLNAPYLDVNGKPAVCAQLSALRCVAAAPHNGLQNYGPVRDIKGKVLETYCSSNDYTPKIHATLRLVEQFISEGEQVAIFSAFNEPLDTVSKYLDEAGVPYELLDGRTDPDIRGQRALDFQRGRPHAKRVMNAGNCMAEGYSWPLCINGLVFAHDWAFDRWEQFINRFHRLTSKRDVHIWTVLAQGTIDRRMDALKDEKKDAAELVLDGKLLGEDTEEVNLAELLRFAYNEFDPKATVDEDDLKRDEWPALRLKLRDSYRRSQSGVFEPVRIVQTDVLPPDECEIVRAVKGPADDLLKELPLFAAFQYKT